MTSKYAALLALKYQAVRESQDTTERYLWNMIYPCIMRHVMKGDMSMELDTELAPTVRAQLLKDGFVVMTCEGAGGKDKTRIIWRDHER